MIYEIFILPHKLKLIPNIVTIMLFLHINDTDDHFELTTAHSHAQHGYETTKAQPRDGDSHANAAHSLSKLSRLFTLFTCNPNVLIRILDIIFHHFW